MKVHGPIILPGVLGAASVPHFILLIGIDTDDGRFYFLDPLTADQVGTAPFQAMQAKIDLPIIYAQPDMANKLATCGLQFV